MLSSSETLAQLRNLLGGREELSLLGMLIVKDATNHVCRDTNAVDTSCDAITNKLFTSTEMLCPELPTRKNVKLRLTTAGALAAVSEF